MTGPEGNSEFCFPQISMFPSTLSRENSLFPNGPFIKRYVIWQNKRIKPVIKTKANFEKHAKIPVTTSVHLQLHTLINVQQQSTFCGFQQ